MLISLLAFQVLPIQYVSTYVSKMVRSSMAACLTILFDRSCRYIRVSLIVSAHCLLVQQLRTIYVDPTTINKLYLYIYILYMSL